VLESPSIAFEYKKELRALGMRDGPQTSSPSATARNRLEILRNTQKGWHSGVLKQKMKLHLPPTRYPVKAQAYNFGIFVELACQGRDPEGDFQDARVRGDETGDWRSSEGLQLRVSVPFDGNGQKPTIHDIGIPYAQCTIACDPSQDLVALTELQYDEEIEEASLAIHLRKLSDPTEQHPEVAYSLPSLDVDEHVQTTPAYSVEIFNDVAVLRVSAQSYIETSVTDFDAPTLRAIIFNWKSGKLLTVRFDPLSRRPLILYNDHPGTGQADGPNVITGVFGWLWDAFRSIFLLYRLEATRAPMRHRKTLHVFVLGRYRGRQSISGSQTYCNARTSPVPRKQDFREGRSASHPILSASGIWQDIRT